MSILHTLNTNGVTAEDLEKAASVRLFEKAAAAEGLNLAELPTSSVDALYNSYNNSNKENPVMDMIDMFEKQAAAEGIDLDLLDDYELAELYNHFVGEDAGYGHDEQDAYEKLAEAELLGEVMADAYLDKIAAATPESYYGKEYADEMVGGKHDAESGRMERLKRFGQKSLHELGGVGATAESKRRLQEAAKKLSERSGGTISETEAMGKLLKRRGALRAGGGLAAGAALGAGAYALAKKRSEKKAGDTPAPAQMSEYFGMQGKAKGKANTEGVKQYTRGQKAMMRLRSGAHQVGSHISASGKQDALAREYAESSKIKNMSAAAQKALSKKLRAQGYAAEGSAALTGEALASALAKRNLTRRGGAAVMGAGALAAGAGYALSRREKKAAIIEELALEKAASWMDDNGWEAQEIELLSDALANDLLNEAAGYDYY